MARRQSKNPGSLDLLLDTICNTFGGILLIALLVIILLNTTSKAKEEIPATQISQSELSKNEIERQNLTHDLKILQNALTASKKNLELLVPKEIIEIAKKLQELKSRLTLRLIKQSELSGELNKSQKSLNDLTTKLQSVAIEMEEIEKKRRELEDQLKKAFEQKASEVAIPKIEKSTKMAISFFLKDGKVYGPVDFFSGNRRLGENEAEFRFVTEDGDVQIFARQDAGTVVPDEFSGIQSIERKFDGMKPNEHIVQMFIWPDSFGRFDLVLKAMNRLNLKKDLVFMKQDDIVHRASRQGPSDVQ